jgi:hypothetical protein
MLTFWVGLCLAGGLVINGEAVPAESAKGLQLQGVDVVIDAAGTIHITAPNYGGAAVVNETPEIVPPDDVAPVAGPTSGWWLVSQDSGSVGHAVDVYINDALVASFRSGQPAQPIHLGDTLNPGANQVTIRSRSDGASGGMFYVLVAKGENTNSEMRLDTPDVQFGLGASRTGAYERTYTVDYTP